jgi:hypothetical protein
VATCLVKKYASRHNKIEKWNNTNYGLVEDESFIVPKDATHNAVDMYDIKRQQDEWNQPTIIYKDTKTVHKVEYIWYSITKKIPITNIAYVVWDIKLELAL